MTRPDKGDWVQLLTHLDAIARTDAYPPQGLPLYGSTARTDELVLACDKWWADVQPEAQR
jgi:hypothetical protein